MGTLRLLAEHDVDGGGEKSTEILRWAESQPQDGRTVVFVARRRQLAGAIALADRIKPEAPAACTRPGPCWP